MNAPKELSGQALRFGSGHTVRRIEDPTLVSGRGQYTDDLQREGLAYLVFVRSPHAHARITGIDTSGALALRRALDTPKARSLPLLMCGRMAEAPTAAASSRPESRSVSCGPVPR